MCVGYSHTLSWFGGSLVCVVFSPHRLLLLNISRFPFTLGLWWVPLTFQSHMLPHLSPWAEGVLVVFDVWSFPGYCLISQLAPVLALCVAFALCALCGPALLSAFCYAFGPSVRPEA